MNIPKKRNRDYLPVTVPFAATQTGEPPPKQQWAHPLVWTESMLTTLLEGKVRGGKWHALYDKVMSERNLSVSAMKVVDKQGAAGVDRQTVDEFEANNKEQLATLREELKTETYRPLPVRRVEIPKPGSSETRGLGIPAVRDRVVQTALLHVLEPIYDVTFLHPEKTNIVDSRSHSFSFLGYSFRGRFRFPRAKSHRKMVDRIRDLTPRKLDGPLEQVIATLSRTLRGWFNYFRHCFWNVFDFYDGLVRKRLRRILLKRHRRNPERLPRNKRWPNAYFSELGLYSLREGHTRFVQSLASY